MVTARELSLEEIRQIRANIPDDMEIETFIHGAMCISYSGRCLLSNYPGRKRCQSGSLYTSVPLEIFHCGRVKTRRIYAGL